MYICELEAPQLHICWFDEEVVEQTQKNDLIWFKQLSIIFSVLMIDDHNLTVNMWHRFRGRICYTTNNASLALCHWCLMTFINGDDSYMAKVFK